MIHQGFAEGNPLLQLFLTILFLTFVCFFLTKMGDKIQLLSAFETLSVMFISMIPIFIYIILFSVIKGFDSITGSIFAQMIGIGLILLISANVVIKQLIFRKSARYKYMLKEKGKIDHLSTLIKASDLKIYFPIYGGFFKRHIADVKAVDKINMEIKSGSTVALVGESGCGKTTLGKSFLGLLKINEGKLIFKGNPMDFKKNKNLIRRNMQMVFQDPDASLNPTMNIFENVSEPLKNLFGISDKNTLRRKVLKALEEVSLNREHMDRYPHEFSGGQKQRIVIARALICQPELIILDEPTSALDVSVQAQILNLLKELQKNYGFGYLFITHDLAVVHHIADEIFVMYLGKIVERGLKEEIFKNPSHPYTQGLLASKSSVNPKERRKTNILLEGDVPSPINPPKGCNFHPRCKSTRKRPECEVIEPVLIKIDENHFMWCRNSSNIDIESFKGDHNGK